MKPKLILSLMFLIGVLSITSISSCQSEEDLEFKRYYTSGALLYQSHCQNCHGANGEGLGQLIPPLNDSIYLKNNKSNLACLVKNGLKGQIMVKGKIYNGQMLQQDNLTPIEIAQVLTYITNSFNNKLKLIDVQQVNNGLKSCSF